MYLLNFLKNIFFGIFIISLISSCSIESKENIEKDTELEKSYNDDGSYIEIDEEDREELEQEDDNIEDDIEEEDHEELDEELK